MLGLLNTFFFLQAPCSRYYFRLSIDADNEQRQKIHSGIVVAHVVSLSYFGAKEEAAQGLYCIRCIFQAYLMLNSRLFLAYSHVQRMYYISNL